MKKLILFSILFFTSVCYATDYEFLIRVKDKESLMSLKGDIVTFKPMGWHWGRLEKKHFAIIKISTTTLTYQKAKEWVSCKPNEISSKKYLVHFEDVFPTKIVKDWKDKNASREPIDLFKDCKPELEKKFLLILLLQERP